MKSLYGVINAGASLTDEQREAFVNLLGKGCQEKTKRNLDRALKYPASIENCGILRRRMLDGTYCAGQSYPDEIRTVRNHILGR